MATTTRGVALNSTLIVAAQSTQAIAVGAIALFLPLIRSDLGVTFAQAGLLAAVSTATYALMQMPSGVLADRLSPKRIFAVGVVGTNILAILFALSDSFAIMLVTQAAAGVFRSLIFVPGIILISRHFTPARRATAMGLFVAGGFSSNILLNLIGPFFVHTVGWQGIIVVSSAIGLAVSAAFILLADDGPPREETGGGSVRWVWRTRAWWLLGLIQFCRLSVVMGVTLWLPTFLIVDRGLSIPVAGLIVAACAAITAPANIGGGILSDRLGRPLLVIGASMGAMCVLLSIVGELAELVPLLVVLALISVFIQLYFGPLFAVPTQLFGPGIAGLSSGFGNLCANIGGFVTTLALGVLKDATGSFSLGFLCLGGLALVGTLAVVALSRSAPSRPPV